MKLDADHELSPQAIAALRDLLQEPEPPREEPSDEQLRAFVLGNVSGAERSFLIGALAHSSPLRNRLLDLRTQLQSRPATILPDEVGRAFGIDGRLDEWESSPDWSRLSDAPAVTTLRATLSAIGRSLSVLLATPRYATVRRGGADAISAELDDEGNLSVEARLDTHADGQTVFLELVDPAGGSVRIDQALAEDSTARFLLPGFGALTGLEPGSLPGNLFRLDSEMPLSESKTGRFLLAATDGPPAVLSVTSPPIWEDGHLEITLVLPTATKSKYPQGRLELYTLVGGIEFPLANVHLADFENGELPLRLPVPGSGNRQAISGSLLRARIASSGPEQA